MAIPAEAFQWHEQGQIAGGKLFYREGAWFLAGVVQGGSGSVPVHIQLTGLGKGILQSQPTGIYGAYVLADAYSWKPVLAEIPGETPPIGHQVTPGALYIGVTRPVFWTRAGHRLVAIAMDGSDVTKTESSSERQPFFQCWAAQIHPLIDSSQSQKLFEVMP